MPETSLRQRKKKQASKKYVNYESETTASKKTTSDTISSSSALSVGNVVLGCAVMVMMGYQYSIYCNTLHENQMYFTNIEEIKREISFRTESGLYYSYYKQFVNAPSITKGLYDLLHDNMTEHTVTMNVLARMNIYQEVVLGIIYKTVKPLQNMLEPVYFYLYSIYGLQGLLLAALYVFAWSLSGSWLSGALAAALYVVNKEDTTRVAFITPLRESFSLPFLWCQLAIISVYFSPGASKLKERLCVPAILLCTFLFALTWQFNQFILLLQSMALFGVQVLQFVPHSKILMVYLVQLFSLVLVCILQFFNTIILTGPLFCFVPAAIIIMRIQGDVPSTRNIFIRMISVLCYIALVFAMTFGFIAVVKYFIAEDSDAHIARFVLVKFGLAEASRDFDVMLYLCNGAFGFLEPTVLPRLTSRLVFPIYAVGHLALLIGLAIALLQKWNAERSIPSNQVLTTQDHKPHLFSSRPELAYHCVMAVFFCCIAVAVTRMKYLWTPYMCVLAAVCVGDFTIWKWLLSKIGGNPSKNLVIIVQNLALIGVLGLLWHIFLPKYMAEMDDLREFFDPDTVELMEWIKKATPVTAAFTGSMQLLAGVKLSTGRPITNHPHYEDTDLRVRTKKLYQMYARQEPDVVHGIMKEYDASYVILEDSICMVKKPDGCGLPSIMDVGNGELPDNVKWAEGLVKSSKARFCDQIRYGGKKFDKYFKPVFKNKTFRIFKVL